MGVSGAGKTTLLDVLAGRKTSGTIEGEILIGGYPKLQETFARVSGYCEQTDIHSPNITVAESLIFSAWLRLPDNIDSNIKAEFVDKVLQTIELNEVKDSLVGLPGINGLSTEQQKRLTIAVELVANPSIIFMDEPTTGLDARAAAIVIQAIKNVVVTVELLFAPSINQVLIYLKHLTRNNEELVQKLSIPSVGSKDLHFRNRFSLSDWEQYKSCLWKQQLSYWRSPSYNLTRLMFALMSSPIFGFLF